MDDIGQQSQAAEGCSPAGLPAAMAGQLRNWVAEPREAKLSRRLTERRPDFLRYFRRRLSRPEDAEDAFQDFCVKAIRAAEELDDGEKLDAWLGRILRNTLIDHYRRRAAWQRAVAAYGREVEGACTVAAPDRDERPCGCIRDIVPMLRPDYADILSRADLNEEPRERIAAELGLTANNVGVRLHRARQALKAKLAEVCPTCHDGGHAYCGCSGARSSGGAQPAQPGL